MQDFAAKNMKSTVATTVSSLNATIAQIQVLNSDFRCYGHNIDCNSAKIALL